MTDAVPGPCLAVSGALSCSLWRGHLGVHVHVWPGGAGSRTEWDVSETTSRVHMTQLWDAGTPRTDG